MPEIYLVVQFHFLGQTLKNAKLLGLPKATPENKDPGRILAVWSQREGLPTTAGGKVGVSLVDVAVNNLSTSKVCFGVST
jgi:hypothetical protein